MESYDMSYEPVDPCCCAEPVVAEPVVAEPVVAEPVVAEPVVAEPVVAEPVVAEPVVAEPVVAEPVAAQPPVDSTVVPASTPVDAPQPQTPPGTIPFDGFVGGPTTSFTIEPSPVEAMPLSGNTIPFDSFVGGPANGFSIIDATGAEVQAPTEATVGPITHGAQSANHQMAALALGMNNTRLNQGVFDPTPMQIWERNHPSYPHYYND